METVGEILRAAREERGLSIKDVEKATNIRALYLTAIEEGNFSVIPGEVYVKGFIRNYANFLGLDGQAMVNMYRQNTAKSSAEGTEVENTPSAESDSGKKFPLKWLLVGLGLVVLLSGGIWLFSGIAKNLNTMPPEAKSSPPAPTQVVPNQPPNPSLTEPTPMGQQTAVQKTKPVIIIAQFTDECWTLITADGKEVFEGIAKAGTSYTWEANQVINAKFGNAGAVELTFNGQKLGVQGNKGEVIVKTFSANTTKKP